MEGQTRYRSNKSDFRGTDGRDVAGNGGERAEHSEWRGEEETRNVFTWKPNGLRHSREISVETKYHKEDESSEKEKWTNWE